MVNHPVLSVLIWCAHQKYWFLLQQDQVGFNVSALLNSTSYSMHYYHLLATSEMPVCSHLLTWVFWTLMLHLNRHGSTKRCTVDSHSVL